LFSNGFTLTNAAQGEISSVQRQTTVSVTAGKRYRISFDDSGTNGSPFAATLQNAMDPWQPYGDAWRNVTFSSATLHYGWFFTCNTTDPAARYAFHEGSAGGATISNPRLDDETLCLTAGNGLRNTDFRCSPEFPLGWTPEDARRLGLEDWISIDPTGYYESPCVVITFPTSGIAADLLFWELMLNQSGLSWSYGQRLEVPVSMKLTVADSVTIELNKPDDNWQHPDLFSTQYVGTDWTPLRPTSIAGSNVSGTGRLSFDIGRIAARHPGAELRIGPVGFTATPVTPTTWGAIKARYR
jgi:hypothetical protein